jgi:formylglycine-generating enzyme required for sulfatase activity
VDVTLKTPAQAKAAATPPTLRTAAGQQLRLVRPAGSFHMGASRREAGRRANESQRLVELTRPFYLALKEVTNAEYRRFQAAHDSGSAEGVSLNGDNYPVVNISWDDAARYCNWLSGKDKLPPAYREQDGRMQLQVPPNTGYRLPTEAEWAYVARVAGRAAPARYPWAGSYPPVSVAGNFADARIADTLAHVVPGYDDGYRGPAPVGSFAAHPLGFHDLGGNVAEWVNDYYTVYPGMAEQVVKDPVGPASGDHRVVRDSSWRHGSVTELRLSYRDYSRTPRPDLGFRIARYAH